MNKATTIWSLVGRLCSKSSSLSSCFDTNQSVLVAKLVEGRAASMPLSFGSGYGNYCSCRHPKEEAPLPPLTFHTEIWPEPEPVATTPGFPARYSMQNSEMRIPAKFAVETYNKEKNAKLRLVRLVCASEEVCLGTYTLWLTLEVADAEGVIKTYVAVVKTGYDFITYHQLVSFEAA